ncbi:hypothetical protein FDUTEX481_01815 [Tolypothrix sp. PCC 7601]|nr:hypothetical protein FDUTEX481_01815 [Tolypothrix sp. PCC 7601]
MYTARNKILWESDLLEEIRKQPKPIQKKQMSLFLSVLLRVLILIYHKKKQE